MGIDTKKYIRKPLYVDAVRVTKQNFDEMVSWCQGKVEEESGKQFIRVRVNFAKIPRQTQAFVGDWILWTETGGYKVYTNRAFEAQFDPVVSEEERVTTPSTPVVENENNPGDAHEPPTEELKIPQDAGGKRVLSEAEQRSMSREEVQELIRSGEVVLEQDAA